MSASGTSAMTTRAAFLKDVCVIVACNHPERSEGSVGLALVARHELFLFLLPGENQKFFLRSIPAYRLAT
jgi:hypothetical protein